MRSKGGWEDADGRKRRSKVGVKGRQDINGGDRKEKSVR